MAGLDSGGDEPRFGRPPVEEVTLAAEFDPMPSLGSVHLSRLGSRWEEEYPAFEEHPALPPGTDETVTPVPGVRLDILREVPPSRIWYVSADGTLVRQVQNDRVIQNWRKTRGGDDYPHFAQLRPLFEGAYGDYVGFIEEATSSRPQSIQAEVAYTNTIRVGDRPGTLGSMGELIEAWSGEHNDDFLPPPETSFLQNRYPIRIDGALIGRLTIQCGPGRHTASGEGVLLLQLTARGRPLGDGLDGVLRFIDLGHHWIVKAFESVTTKEMHALWELRR